MKHIRPLQLLPKKETTELLNKALPAQEPPGHLLERLESRLEIATRTAHSDLDQFELKSLAKGQKLSKVTWAALVFTGGGLSLWILRHTPIKRFLGPLKPR